MPSAARSTSASSKTMAGALPPSSRWTFLRFSAACRATSLPARTEPVTDTICGIGCADQLAAGVAVAADDVEDARRQELRGDLGHQERRDRRGVGRLEDDGVAGGQRRRDLPGRHHHRVVPGGDLRADADGLAADHRGVVGEVLARGASLQQPGAAREEPELIDHRADLLVPGELERFAGVAALGLDELLGPGLDGVGDAQQGQASLLRRDVAPRLEGGRGRGHRGVDVGGSGQRRLGVHLPRTGVDDVGRTAVLCVDALAVDEVSQSHTRPPDVLIRMAPTLAEQSMLKQGNPLLKSDLTTDSLTFRALVTRCRIEEGLDERRPRTARTESSRTGGA